MLNLLRSCVARAVYVAHHLQAFSCSLPEGIFFEIAHPLRVRYAQFANAGDPAAFLTRTGPQRRCE